MRAVLMGFLLLVGLTACTGSGAPDAHVEPTRSTSPVAGPTPDAPGSATRAAATSLPCPRGTPRRLVGARHTIVGAVFAPRLVSPPARQYRNKVLWTSRQRGSADLLVSATL